MTAEKENKMTSDYVTIDEIRKMVDEVFGQSITRSAVYGYIRRRGFPKNIGMGRPRLWRKEAVRGWLGCFLQNEPQQIGKIKITHDPSADAYYVYLRGAIKKGGVARTVRAAKGINLDYDKKGLVIGIEILY